MNRAKLGIGGLVGILTCLLMLAAANIQFFASPAHDDRNESVLVVLGYEPGSARAEIPVVAQPVLVECQEVDASRPSTV